MNKLFKAVKIAHNRRVKKGLVPPTENEEMALKFAYHLTEEAMEVVQSLPFRKEWKEKLPVDKKDTLGELADVAIMMIIVCQYLGIEGKELEQQIIDKLNIKREDWID